MVYEGWTAAPAVAPAAATAQLDENNTSDGYLQRHEQEMPLRPNGSTAIPEETGSRAPSRQACMMDTPDDMLALMLSWLSVRDLGAAMAASRRLAREAGTDQLWLPLFTARFGSGKRGASSSKMSSRAESYFPFPPRMDNLVPVQGSPSAPDCQEPSQNIDGVQPSETGKTVSPRGPTVFPHRDRGRGDEEGRGVRLGFRSRLACPIVGDHVQVAWRGKFRLDTDMVFVGVSWWNAKVVGIDFENCESSRHPPTTDSRKVNSSGTTIPNSGPIRNGSASGLNNSRSSGGSIGGFGEGCFHPRGDNAGCDASEGDELGMAEGFPHRVRFRVHYRTWSRRWDQSVSSDRLRWKSSVVPNNRHALRPPGVSNGAELAVDQQVELWCPRDAAGGAWLDAQIRKISHTLVCVSDTAMSSELLWVSRDRVRPKTAAPITIAEFCRRAFGGRETGDAPCATVQSPVREEGAGAGSQHAESEGRSASTRRSIIPLQVSRRRSTRGRTAVPGSPASSRSRASSCRIM